MVIRFPCAGMRNSVRSRSAIVSSMVRLENMN